MRHLNILIFFFLTSFATPVKAYEESPLAEKIKNLDTQGINLTMKLDEINDILQQQGYAIVPNKSEQKYDTNITYLKQRDHSVNIRANTNQAENPYPYKITYTHAYRKIVPHWTKMPMASDARRIADTMCDKIIDGSKFRNGSGPACIEYPSGSMSINIPYVIEKHNQRLYSLKVYTNRNNTYGVEIQTLDQNGKP